MENQKKSEIQYLEAVFVSFLITDKFFTLVMQGQQKKMAWSRVLKVAHDRCPDYCRRTEYWNLHKYAELLGI